jgi:hypothetical protein
MSISILICSVLACAVVALAIIRKRVALNEDDVVHMTDQTRTARQFSVAAKLERIDRLGKALTAVVIVYALVLLGQFLYVSWQQSQQLVWK